MSGQGVCGGDVIRRIQGRWHQRWIEPKGRACQHRSQIHARTNKGPLVLFRRTKVWHQPEHNKDNQQNRKGNRVMES